MTAKYSLFMITCTFLFSRVYASSAWAEPPEGLSAFVQNTAADLSSSPLQVAPFKAAMLDTVEDLGPSGGIDRYLCWLKNDQGRVGYLAVAGRSGTYRVVAFSATGAPPNYVLQHLEVAHLPTRSADLTKATAAQFSEKVPLVAAGQIMLAGKETVNLSELSCALASLLGYLQREKKMLLFGYPDFLFNKETLAKTVTGPPPDPAKLKANEDLFEARKKELNWRPFEEEAQEALAREGLNTPLVSPQIWAQKVRARRFLAPLRRQRLLNPLSPEERFGLMSGEYEQLQSVTGASEITRGKRAALLLQEDYLGTAPDKLQDDLRVFFKTRGLFVDVNVAPFAAGRSDALPCLVVGGAGTAAVLLGYVRAGEGDFALLYCPGTGDTRYETLADRLRKTRAVAARGTGATPESQNEEHQKRMERIGPEERAKIEASVARMQAQDEKIIVGEDILSSLPDSLRHGAHVVDCASLRSWKMARLGKVELGDNWGMSPHMKVHRP